MYTILLDQDAQERADKRRNGILFSQHDQLVSFWGKRLGLMQYQTPRLRREWYMTHQPVFAVDTTLDEWLSAVDHVDDRAMFLAMWGSSVPALLEQLPPQGPVMGPVDPMTGQPTVLAEGPPNYDLRVFLWSLARERVLTTGEVRMGDVLTSYYRERYTFNPKPVVAELRDMRQLFKPETQRTNGNAPAYAGVV
jgi:hypothetical protein